MPFNPGLRFSFGIIVATALAAVLGLGAHLRVQAADALPYVVTQMGSDKPAGVQLAAKESTAGDAVIVSQKGRTFSPAQVTIKAHRQVAITNDDDTKHHAFCSAENFKYTSGAMAEGTTVKITFDKPGTYEVRCAIHPQMLLTVVVTPASE